MGFLLGLTFIAGLVAGVLGFNTPGFQFASEAKVIFWLAVALVVFQIIVIMTGYGKPKDQSRPMRRE